MKVTLTNFMKRKGNLWQQFISKDNIALAVKKACKNTGKMTKAKRRAILRVKQNTENVITRVQLMLEEGTFKTSPYNIYPLFDPKLRLIYSLPLYPDRIIHHCLLNILEKFWDNLMIFDSYACRSKHNTHCKGQHKAGTKAGQFAMKYKYCAQLDISQFYVNINHNIMKQILRHKLKDEKILKVLDDIVDSISTRDKNLQLLEQMKKTHPNCKDVQVEIQKLTNSRAFDLKEPAGLPIGSYTSQWFGNLYMNELDMFVKHKLHCKAYVRYCDDFLIFSDDKKVLHEVTKEIEVFLKEHLHLLLSRCRVFPTSQGIDFVGYRYFHNGKVLLRKRTAKRIRRRLKALPQKLTEGRIRPEKARSVLASDKGILKWAKSYNFRKSIDIEKIQKIVEEHIA